MHRQSSLFFQVKYIHFKSKIFSLLNTYIETIEEIIKCVLCDTICSQSNDNENEFNDCNLWEKDTQDMH